MNIAEKYGIPPDVVKQMIKDGWLNCSLAKYEEVISLYEKNIAAGMPKLQAITNTGAATKISDRQVYRIISKFY